MRVRLPRLYVFVILVVAIFSAVNISVLYMGKNVLAAIYQIDQWVGIILLGLIGAILIGMYAAYRLFTLRSFTPFEREMMEMRVEVTEIKKAVEAVAARVETMGAAGCGGDEARNEGEGQVEPSEGKGP